MPNFNYLRQNTFSKKWRQKSDRDCDESVQIVIGNIARFKRDRARDESVGTCWFQRTISRPSCSMNRYRIVIVSRAANDYT